MVFLESYDDPTKSGTHDKNSDEKYEHNIHIIKINIAVCRTRDNFKSHREQDSLNDEGKTVILKEQCREVAFLQL